MTMKGFDSFNFVTRNMQEFLDFLAEREKGTTRLTVRAADVRFLTIEKALTKYRTVDELASRVGVDKALVEDTAQNTNIIASVEGFPYLLGGSSWVSTKNRVVIYGSGFEKLKPETKVTVLNERFQDLENRDVIVVVADGKIRAIMSDEYAVISSAELFQKTIETVAKRFTTIEMLYGDADHNRTEMKVLLPEMKDELNRLYNLPVEYTPGLVIRSSDTGFSANQIGPFFQYRKGRITGSWIMAGEYIYLVHKGSNTLDKVLDELPNLFLRFQNTVKKFASLMMVEIDMPLQTLKRACKHLGLGKKMKKALVTEFEASYQPGQTVTAYDLCLIILSAPSLVDDAAKTALEEKVGKAINLNFKALSSDDDEDDDN